MHIMLNLIMSLPGLCNQVLFTAATYKPWLNHYLLNVLMHLPTDERLLKALADAIVLHPRATLKELAEAAGVSKATLHRFCGTRDNLVNMLERYGDQVLSHVIDNADLHGSDPAAALHRLIVEHREMMIFLLFQYRPDSFDDSEANRPWRAYADALDAFFLRGQQAGAFRIDISAAIFTEMFLSMVYGIVDAERRGRAASATSVHTLELLFLDGAAAPARADSLRASARLRPEYAAVKIGTNREVIG